MHSSPPRSGNVVATGVVDPRLLERCIELQAKAKSELKRVILLLDLAVWKGREVANQIADPNVRATINQQLTSIEEALQIARERARDI